MTIAVFFSATQSWLTALTAYNNQESITTKYFDPETATQVQTQMYVEGFKVKLKKDTNYKGVWMVRFALRAEGVLKDRD